MEMIAGADDGGRRLDRLLRKALPDMPLSAIHRLLRQGRVLAGDKPGGAADRIGAGTVIRILGDAADGARRLPRPDPPSRERGAAPSPELLLEAPGLLLVNKPAGMPVHGPAPRGETLETLVRSFLADRLSPSLSFRPGPLHRLDRNTSGVMVFSSSLEGARRFSALLREGRVVKRYLALAEGRIEGEEVWEDHLFRDRAAGKSFIAAAGTGTGRRALTKVRALANSDRFSLILLEIATGRTHQIRAQAAARGHPLAGDRKYGGGPRKGGFLLHALSIAFPWPEAGAGDGILQARAPLPKGFRSAAAVLLGDPARRLDFRFDGGYD
jgi:23S rRNA pseudouridine955/2504/2580 synthase